MSQYTLVERLRDHERIAVHDKDDSCMEAAAEIERLTRENEVLRDQNSELNAESLRVGAEIERLRAIISNADGMLFDNPNECGTCRRVRAYFQSEARVDETKA